MSWTLTNLSAQSCNGTALLTWAYSDPLAAFTEVTNLFVNYTDEFLNDNAIQNTTTEIIPLYDTVNGGLVTSYMLNNILNGVVYLISIEAVTLSNVIVNSNTIKLTPSSIPPTPETFLLTQTSGASFNVNLSLSNSQLISPTPISDFDGFSPLTAVYVTFNDGNNIITNSFNNDSNNSIYTSPLTISNLSIGSYEVSVKLRNANGFTGQSLSQTINVEVPIPGAPQNLQAIPTMLVDPSFNAYNSPPSITVSWQPPQNIGNPELNSYSVLRDNILIATILPDSNNNIATFYVDNMNGTGLVAGQSYNYTVTSNSFLTSAALPPNSASILAVAIIPPTLNSFVKTSDNNQFILDVSYNINGFLSNQISFDVSGNNQIGLQNFTQHPVVVANLVNGTTYSHQVRVVATANGLSFPSSFSNVTTSTPYAPLLPVDNFVVSNVDGSGNSLNSKLNLSWDFPNLPSYQASQVCHANIYRKLSSSPDASYNFLVSVSSIASSFYQDTGLTNGISYTYKILNSQFNTDVSGNIYSTSVDGSSIPFNTPSAPSNLSFTEGTMAYNFTGSANNGGLQLSGYLLTLTNVSNGTSGEIQTINLTDVSNNILITSGNLLTYVLPGRKYELKAQAYVTNNNVTIYSLFSNVVTAFSAPLQLNAPVVSNVDASGNPINNGNSLSISWELNDGYDASNAVYILYRNGAPQPIVGANNLNVTNYVNSGLTNGSLYYYTVVVKLGSLYSPLSNVSNTISPFSYPSTGVQNLTYSQVNSSSVSLNWAAPSLSGTGVAPSSVFYRILDASSNVIFNNLATLSQNITGLTPGIQYIYYVQVGILSNNNIYYSSGSQAQIIVATYMSIPAPTNFLAYPSDNSVMIDVANAPNVFGLQFQMYCYQYTLSNILSWSNVITQSNSLFYIPNLLNGNTYTVKVFYSYLDANNNTVYSPEVFEIVTPSIAPASPSGLAVSTNIQSLIKVSFNIDTTNNAPTNYSFYKDYEPLALHVPAVPGAFLQYDSVNNTWFFNDYNVVPGVSYIYNIVAEKVVNSVNVTYVSSSASQIIGSAWAPPSQVQNISYVPSNNSVTLNWQAPLYYSGAGINGNSGLKYNVTIVNPDSGNTAVLSNQPQDGLSVVISGSITDGSSNTFVITNMVQYTVSVTALFYVDNNPAVRAISNPVTIQVQPRQNQVQPILTATAINKSDQGKQILLNLTIDPSSNLNNVDVSVTRVIKNYSGTTIATISNKPLSLSFDDNLSAVFIDSPNSNIGYDVDNFLNGNVIYYTFTVTQNNWTVGGVSNSGSTQTISVTPSGMAIIQSMLFDSSGNVSYILNKNGTSVNSLVTIGFDNSGNTVQVKQENTFTNSLNVQINGVVAANQLINYISSAWNPAIQQALAIFSTANSSVLKDIPAGSIIGNNI